MATAERRTRQGVGIDLNVCGVRPRELLRDLVREATRECCLSGAGRAGQQNQSMEGGSFKGKLLPDSQGEERLGHQPLLDSLRNLNRGPGGVERGVRQLAPAGDPLRIVEFL